MKKIISFLAAAVLTVSAVPASFAQVEPTVKVDGRMVDFRDDQAPVIMEDRLYVPIRRVLEEMGARVTWNGEDRTVLVSSDTNTVKLLLTIDSKEIIKETFTTVLVSNKETLISDVAPVIIGGRTMLPIRIVAESIGATVKWDDKTKLTSITSRLAKKEAEVLHGADTTVEDFDVTEFFKDKVPHLSISCDNEDINEGDIVELKVKLSDLEKAGENKQVTILTASVFYNENNFRYTGYDFIIDGEKKKGELSSDNANFMPGMVKLIALNTYMKSFMPGEDDAIAVIYFKALNGEGGEFALSDGKTDLGPNTSVTLYEEIEEKPVLTDIVEHDELYIDTTPVVLK